MGKFFKRTELERNENEGYQLDSFLTSRQS